MRVAVAAIFKNEAPYILEWLAHHRNIGFTDFVIADNGSTDGTSELLAALEKIGVVRHVPYPTEPGVAPQLLAYDHLISNHLSDFDWVAFIDADEFVKVGSRSVTDMLSAMPEDCGGVILNWSTFGTSGHLAQTPGLVIERFRCRAERDFPPNRHFKTIVRRRVAKVGLNPHTFELEKDFHFAYPNGENANIATDGTATMTDHVNWSGGWINHYIVKSTQEFFSKKRPRGRGTIGSLRPFSFFDSHDRNEEQEPADYAWYGAISAGIQDIERRLFNSGFPESIGRQTVSLGKARGSVDSAVVWDSSLLLRGWAVDTRGIGGGSDIAVQVGGEMPTIQEIKITNRQDVVNAGGAKDPLCGFEVTIAHKLGIVPASALRVYVGGKLIPLNKGFQVRARGI